MAPNEMERKGPWGLGEPNLSFNALAFFIKCVQFFLSACRIYIIIIIQHYGEHEVGKHEPALIPLCTVTLEMDTYFHTHVFACHWHFH